MRIDIEEVAVHKARQALWNSYDLSEVEIYKNGEKFTPDPEQLEMLKYTGFSTTDLIHMMSEEESDEEDDEDVFDDGPFNGLVPNNLTEAVGQIGSKLSIANIIDIQRTDKDNASICLNGTGIRNEWNLWGKSNLSLWFAEQGIYHADDMSYVICHAVWDIVNNDHTPIGEHIKVFDAHWKEYECDVKAEFEKRCSDES